MPMRAPSARRCLAAALVPLLLAGLPVPAFAFSQIDPGSGSSDSREGIIAVPLPPLPSPEKPAATAPATTSPASQPDRSKDGEPSANEPEGTDSEEVPLSPEDEDILLQRRQPGRGDSVDDTAPLRPDAPAEPSPSRTAPQERSTPATTGAIRAPARPGPPGATEPAPAQEGGAPDAAQLGEAATPTVPLPSEIAFDENGLPAPVRDLRRKLMEIARTGEIEKLRPYLQTGDEATVLSFGDTPDDPIAFLKQASGDGEGVEMLAILLEVLQAGHAHVEPGDSDEIYVWPYFTQVQIDRLTKPQMVQLFEIVTAGDYDAMKAFGAYNFFRVGISPDGKLEFFVAGD